MRNDLSRRELLACAGAAAALSPLAAFGRQAPAEPVSVAKCASYGSELLPTLERMFDQLGGLGRLVMGKTVAIKLNLTGIPSYRLGHTPAEDAHWTHPRVVAATVHLLGKAGARRIRLLESPWSLPIRSRSTCWSKLSSDILSGRYAEFENTNWPATRRNTPFAS
jgi:hypothetical protein